MQSDSTHKKTVSLLEGVLLSLLTENSYLNNIEVLVLTYDLDSNFQCLIIIESQKVDTIAQVSFDFDFGYGITIVYSLSLINCTTTVYQYNSD